MARTRSTIAGLTVLAALSAAAPAWASTASVTADDTITVAAGAGEQNYVQIDNDEVSDRAGIAPGPGCEPVTPTKVRCALPAGHRVTIADLGDGDDYYHDQGNVTRDDVDAGAGNDEVYLDLEDDVARGGAGDDELSGSSGNDQLDGGEGNDRVIGGPGGDTLFGGPGTDTIEGDGTTLSNGNDTISAEDGEKDAVSCDGGSDLVTADEADVVESYGCEDVTRKPVGGVPRDDEVPGGDTTAPAVDVQLPTKLRLRQFLKSGFAFTATFDEPVAFAAVLYVARRDARRLGLGRKDTRIAQGGGSAQAGSAQAVLTKRFKTARLRALLRRRGLTRLPVVFEAVAQDAAGNATPVRRKLSLRI